MLIALLPDDCKNSALIQLNQNPMFCFAVFTQATVLEDWRLSLLGIYSSMSNFKNLQMKCIRNTANTYTVNLGIKKLLNKEQIFADYQDPFTINPLLNKELWQNLALMNTRLWILAKK